MAAVRSAELRDGTLTVVARLQFDASVIRKAMADQCARIAASNPALSAVDRELGLEVASIVATASPLHLHGSLFSRLGMTIARYESSIDDSRAALFSLRLFGETLRAFDEATPDAWRRAVVQAVDAWKAIGAAVESLDAEFENLANCLNDAVIDLR